MPNWKVVSVVKDGETVGYAIMNLDTGELRGKLHSLASAKATVTHLNERSTAHTGGKLRGLFSKARGRKTK